MAIVHYRLLLNTVNHPGLCSEPQWSGWGGGPSGSSNLIRFRQVETSDVSVSLAGLITATTYNVRVKSGNAAGYRDDCPYAEVSFKTKDNRK